MVPLLLKEEGTRYALKGGGMSMAVIEGVGGEKRGGLLAVTRRRLSTSMAVGLCCRPFHAVIVMGARVQIGARTFLLLADSIGNRLGGHYSAVLSGGVMHGSGGDKIKIKNGGKGGDQSGTGVKV